MSQYEPLALVLLGALLALIGVVVFSRVLWEMAMHVMRRRRQKEVPSQLVALQAERDKFRAEAAMATSRMEATVTTIKDKMVALEADVSRARNEQLRAEGEVKQRDQQIEDQAAEILKLREDFHVLRHGGGAAAKIEAPIVEGASKTPESYAVIEPLPPSQATVIMEQTPVNVLFDATGWAEEEKSSDNNITDLAARRAKFPKRASGGGIAEITQRLKDMGRSPKIN